MKKFTIEIKGASSAQLLTIAAELKIMSNAWTKFGPRILINGQKLQPPSLRIPATHKRGPRNGPRAQAASFKHPIMLTQLNDIK